MKVKEFSTKVMVTTPGSASREAVRLALMVALRYGGSGARKSASLEPLPWKPDLLKSYYNFHHGLNEVVNDDYGEDPLNGGVPNS